MASCRSTDHSEMMGVLLVGFYHMLEKKKTQLKQQVVALLEKEVEHSDNNTYEPSSL